MTILGIDTSFDDTAAAVVRDTTILSNALSSDLSQYQEWGGVVPKLARRSHEEHLGPVVTSALKRAYLTMEAIDAIAVTKGPGLSITLEIGVAKAKELAIQYNKPLIAVNHMEGHLLSVLAQPKSEITPKQNAASLFPAMAVLISGRHTEFVLAKEIGSYAILGSTQDDAMGEAYDKVGRMLGLGYPAGALMEKLAKEGQPGAIVFPVPMRSVKSADMSFSGLKTAAMRIVEKQKLQNSGLLSKQDICDIALGFQVACTTHIREKLTVALNGQEVKSLFFGGGVAVNLALRKTLRAVAKEHELSFHVPYTKRLCVDNAAMIAIAGAYKAARHEYVEDMTTFDRDPVLSF